MASRKDGYVLNCVIPKPLGEKLVELIGRTGETRTAVVAQALTNYFQVLEVQAAVVDRLKTDPEYVARLSKLMEQAGDA